MKNSMCMPCTDWVEKLAIRNSDDLSYSQRVALNEHLASCSACASSHSAHQAIAGRICSLPAVEPLASLPYELLQHVERSVSRREQFACMFSGILIWLRSLSAASIHFLQRVDYASDNHYCYALRADSHFLVWRYKKSNVFFSSAAMKNGVPYVTSFDAQVFLLGSRLRLFSDSFLWRQ